MLNCNNCHWSGDPSELVSKSDDLKDKDFSFCPYCGGNDFDEDDDDENHDQI